MKIRQGFVSNSSSSSFVVPTQSLSEEQISKLGAISNMTIGQWGDSWNIYKDGNQVRGFTIMNNGWDEGSGGLLDWLIANDFPLDSFTWEHD